MDPHQDNDGPSSYSASSALTPFIKKLFEIITTEDDCIRWGAGGETIIVTDANKFAAKVLPRYFKHDNIRSFIRQLNIYGFQRCRSTPAAVSTEVSTKVEFYHEYFREGRRDLMRQITRGVASQKRGVPIAQAPPHAFAQDASALLREMRYVQDNLVSVDHQLRAQISQVHMKMSALSDALSAMHDNPAGFGLEYGGQRMAWTVVG